MKALINPSIIEQGYYQVVQISESDFDVAEPLYWVECSNDIIAYIDWYDFINKNFVKLNPPLPSADQNKLQAIKLLAITDWVNEPDVYNVNNSPHLVNRDEFLSYRIQLRQVAVYPTAGLIEWPLKPKEQWSQ